MIVYLLTEIFKNNQLRFNFRYAKLLIITRPSLNPVSLHHTSSTVLKAIAIFVCLRILQLI